jgi:lipoic acid synthetase
MSNQPKRDTTRKPSWLKVRLPTGERLERFNSIKETARYLRLSTVCEEARCPNQSECWGGGTATFMVMGSVCTRGCRFCAVNTSRNAPPLDIDEPGNVAGTIAEMKLDYVVLTSVNRDDLPDQGSSHFANCISETQKAAPDTMVEVLIPDFQGREDLVDVVLSAKPSVVAHNIETVRRLTSAVRDPRASYDQSLAVLKHMKRRGFYTKSSIMVGVGELKEEVIEAMYDLRSVGVDFLTIGQYLRPSEKHLAVHEYITPEQFEDYKKLGDEMGFASIASGPLVRSSYKAGELFIKRHITRENQTGARL